MNAQENGANGIMMLPPMRYSADKRETLTFYEVVAKSVDLPIMVYNNPIDYKIEITLDMFERFKRKKAGKGLENTRAEFKKAIDDNITISQDSIDGISKILVDFEKYKYSNHDAFLNLCIFSDIVIIDLTILLERIRIAEREQERKLYARVIAVTLIDYLDNISVLIGRDCLRELKTNHMNEFIDEFKSIHKKIVTFLNNIFYQF